MFKGHPVRQIIYISMTLSVSYQNHEGMKYDVNTLWPVLKFGTTLAIETKNLHLRLKVFQKTYCLVIMQFYNNTVLENEESWRIY